MKNYWTYITLLVIVILVSTLMSSLGSGRKESYADENSYKCKDLIIQIMTSQGKSEAMAKREIDAILEVEPSDYAKIMGIDYANIPAEMKKKLPKLNLGEMILQMKRNVLLDESGNDVPVDTCVLPVTYLIKLLEQSPKEINLRKGTQYDKQSNETKVCKIGNIELQSNIKNSLTDDIMSLTKLNPRNDRLQYYGCTIEYTNLLELRNILVKLFQYSDVETMKQIKDLMSEFNVTWTKRMDAQNNNLESMKELKKANADRVAAQRKVPQDYAILNEQVKATQNSVRNLQNSEITKNNLNQVIYSSGVIGYNI